MPQVGHRTSENRSLEHTAEGPLEIPVNALKDPAQRKLQAHVFKVCFVWEGKLTLQDLKDVLV